MKSCSPLLVGTLLVLGCAEPDSGPRVLTAERPLHLEEHFETAVIEASEVPAELPQAVAWSFAEPQPGWKPVIPFRPEMPSAELTRVDDALRVTLPEDAKNEDDEIVGGFYLDLPDWQREDWAQVVVEARTSEKVSSIGLGFNLRRDAAKPTDDAYPFDRPGDRTNIVKDGKVQTYVLRADRSAGMWHGPWQQIGFWFFADEPGSIDILSIRVTPKESSYDQPAGRRIEKRNRVYRNALYAHAPARFRYRLRVPPGGRLDVGLGVLRNDAPVTFRVVARPQGGDTVTLFEEPLADKESWSQRSVDLSELEGQIVDLTLVSDAERVGTVALWGAPIVSGSDRPDLPNVIFYVIDGGGADFMSAYGYNRRTTPNLERLAAQGTLFERAYSNASWTRPSTASFMTGLYNSVMGGFLNWNEGIPDQAVTMAEHMHHAGYLTAVFTANPNAGTLSNLQRGVDLFREDWEDFAYYRDLNPRESSRFLHEGFWDWRAQYPAEPFWVHFQPTDVHENFPAVEPFAGLFVGPEDRRTWDTWNRELKAAGGHWIYSKAYQTTDISRTEFFSLHQGMYDETLAHNDYQLGRLIDRLQAAGEWENTLLVIGGDHSTRAALDDMGVAVSEELPPRWGHPMFRPSISRVPLIFVWPGHIPAGRSIQGPVSMIDVLPTVLDLVGLPPAESGQGRSLAAAILDTGEWQPHPVILDEFRVDPESGELRGLIEVVDGRWGASLEINPARDRQEEGDDKEEDKERRPVPLLLYDLWNDPVCLHSVHEEHPELVEKYTRFLEGQWLADRLLAQRFSRSEAQPLNPEQLRTLRALGYIE